MQEVINNADNTIDKCIGDAPAHCQVACPLHLDVRRYVELASKGQYSEALRIIKDKLPFPATLGRICTHPCEKKCKRGEVDDTIAIMALKRAAAAFGKFEENTEIQNRTEKVAVVGGGPAGLMAAYDLRKLGYQVTIFESAPVLGGMLALCIPEYRLPRNVLRDELGIIQKLGIQVRLNTAVGRDIKLGDLKKNYQAVFIAIGAHQHKKPGIKNTGYKGVVDGVNFLKVVNAGGKIVVSDRALIVGGGDVAVDCARSCVRLGFKDVNIMYRRSRAEMPAIKAEIEEAEKEGVGITLLAVPTRVITEGALVLGADCVKMNLNAPDADGRRRPNPIQDSNFVVETDLVILATGEQPDLSLLDNDSVELSTANGLLVVDNDTLQTSVRGIFAGGDVVTGPNTVIDALADGRRAAAAIDNYINKGSSAENYETEEFKETDFKLDLKNIEKEARNQAQKIPVESRRDNFLEVETGFTEPEAEAEAHRCMQCNCRLCIEECEFLKIKGKPPKILAEQFKARYFQEEPKTPFLCNVCGLCQRVCPNELNVGEMCLGVRRQMVADKLAPLPQHAFLKRNLDWAGSEHFKLAETHPQTGVAKKIFFPGCNLSGYSPDLVSKTYNYLTAKIQDIGIILSCCGSPWTDTGQMQAGEDNVKTIISEIKKLGGEELVLACPNCYRMFKHHVPWLKVTSLYEVLIEIGIPDESITKEIRTFSIHDSCSARWEQQIQQSIRKLLGMMGYLVEEVEYSRDKTRCCGIGGLVPYADMKFALEIIRRRKLEFKADIVTYCATCREAIANTNAPGKPCLHILDLMFNPDWKQGRFAVPNTGKKRRENQAKLKKLIIEQNMEAPSV